MDLPYQTVNFEAILEAVNEGTGPGPAMEQTTLQARESDAFRRITEQEAYDEEMVQLNSAIAAISRPLSIAVLDGFQGRARRMWRVRRPVA